MFCKNSNSAQIRPSFCLKLADPEKLSENWVWGSATGFGVNGGHWDLILEIRPCYPLGKIVLYNFYVLRFSQFGLQRPQIPLFTKLGSSHPNWQFCSYFHFTSYFAQTTPTELVGAQIASMQRILTSHVNKHATQTRPSKTKVNLVKVDPKKIINFYFVLFSSKGPVLDKTTYYGKYNSYY